MGTIVRTTETKARRGRQPLVVATRGRVCLGDDADVDSCIKRAHYFVLYAGHAHVARSPSAAHMAATHNHSGTGSVRINPNSSRRRVCLLPQQAADCMEAPNLGASSLVAPGVGDGSFWPGLLGRRS
jgi:hypothetical protein